MKKHIFLMMIAIILVFYSSCYNEGDTIEEYKPISPEILELITHHGFSTDGALKLAEGYLIEGDIIMTEKELRSKPLNVRVPNEEQYHTFNLVSALPRTVTIGFDRKLDQSIKDATIAAMARYNSENLNITFAEVGGGSGNSSGGSGSSSAGEAGPPGGSPPGGGNGGGNGGDGGKDNADIVISKAPKNASYLASAGFPTSGGDPHNSIKVNQDYLLRNNWSFNTVVTIMAHEIGHCVGFRHTDWYNRSISCGSGGNEGQENSGVGAIHIPGTPSYNTQVDGQSFMLSCIGNGIDRPFSNDDKTALNCLYDALMPCTQ